MHGVFDRAGSVRHSRLTRRPVLPSAPGDVVGTRDRISRLITQPTRAPVNAWTPSYGRNPMTRGRCDSLSLQRRTLSFLPPRRFIPAHLQRTRYRSPLSGFSLGPGAFQRGHIVATDQPFQGDNSFGMIELPWPDQ